MPTYQIITPDGPLPERFDSVQLAVDHARSLDVKGARVDMAPPTSWEASKAFHERAQAIGGDENMPARALKNFISLNNSTQVVVRDNAEEYGTRIEFPCLFYVPAREGYIGYTPDLRYLMEGRYKSVPIRKFISEFTDQGGPAAEQLANEYINNTSPLTFKMSFHKHDFIDAYLEKEMYFNGANSCMARGGENFGLDDDDHPASAYAGDEKEHPDPISGDLSVGDYTKRLAIATLYYDDTVKARSVVWPKKKVYVRCYGAESSHAARLAAKLRTLGYEQNTDMAGAKVFIRKHPHGGTIAPYLDGTYKHVSCDGTIGSEGVEWNEICGRVTYSDDKVCERCDGACDETEEVMTRILTRRTENWCIDCREEATFFCEALEGYVDAEFYTEERTVDGVTVCLEFAQRLGFVLECDLRGGFVSSRGFRRGNGGGTMPFYGNISQRYVRTSRDDGETWVFPDNMEFWPDDCPRPILVDGVWYAPKCERYPDGIETPAETQAP